MLLLTIFRFRVYVAIPNIHGSGYCCTGFEQNAMSNTLWAEQKECK